MTLSVGAALYSHVATTIGMCQGTQLDGLSAGDTIRVRTCEKFMPVRDVCL
jgi:hypothetical protein